MFTMRVLNYTIHVEKMTGRRKWTLFCVSVLMGAGIWFLLPYFTGEAEAFDAPNYYRGALIFCGIILGIIEGRGFWLWPLGITIGQLAVFLGFGTDHLMTIKLIFIIVPTTIVSFAATIVGAAIVLIITVRRMKIQSVPNGAENGS